MSGRRRADTAQASIHATSWQALTVPMIGLILFTASVISARFSFAQLGIAVAIIGLVFKSRELRFPGTFWWGVAYVVWAAVTTSFAISFDTALDTTLERVKVVVVLLVVVSAMRTERQARIFLFVVLACFMLFPARGSLQNYVTGYTLFGRLIWNQIYANPNDLGAMALLVSGVALSFAVRASRRAVFRWASVGCIVVLGAVILLTQSRGVFLGVCIGMGPEVLARIRKQPKLAVYGVIGLLVLIPTVPDKVWERLSGITQLTSTSTIAQADPEGSAGQRWEIQKTAWAIFSDHPLTGVGLGCYPLANATYAPHLGARDTHNTYLNLAAELGLPGLILWLAMVLSVLRYARRQRLAHPEHELGRATIWIERAVIGYLVAGCFGTYSGLTILYLLLGTLWCVASQASAGILRSPAEARIGTKRKS